MRHEVELTDDAAAEMSRLAPGPKAEVNAVLKRLRNGTDSRFDLRLQGEENRWRARAGRRWRVIFSVEPGRRIVVRRILRRPIAYRGREHPGYQELQEPLAPYIAEGSSVTGDIGEPMPHLAITRRDSVTEVTKD